MSEQSWRLFSPWSVIVGCSLSDNSVYLLHSGQDQQKAESQISGPWFTYYSWTLSFLKDFFFLWKHQVKEFLKQKSLLHGMTKRAELKHLKEKAMAPHSSTLAWKIPWTEEPSGLQSMGLQRVGHDWATSLPLFTFMHWQRKWQPTPVFLPGESQGRGSLVGCLLWGRTESDTTEVT